MKLSAQQRCVSLPGLTPEQQALEIRNHIFFSLLIFGISSILMQERRTACESLTERQHSCQDSLAQVRAELAQCQADAAKRSAAAAVAEATLQQALSAAEADYKSSIQAGHASVPEQG